jgi:unsaturated rhamnogalacturonyl hydrolase
MSKCKQLFYLVILTILFNPSNTLFSQDVNSIDVVKKVTDKIIRDTSFKFKLVTNKPGKTVQIVDFEMEYGNRPNSIAYAYTNILSNKDTTIQFGLSSSGPIKIWVNNQLKFEKTDDFNKDYKIVAYDFFEFPYHVKISLHKGINPCLVKLISNDSDWIFNMAAINDEGEFYRPVTYSLKSVVEDEINTYWLITGPFTNKIAQSSTDILHDIFPPEGGFKQEYKLNNQYFSWAKPKTVMILDDVIEPDVSFKKHSYFEWNYANGETMLSILTLADHTGINKYFEFVKRFCDFTLQEMPYFRYQYHDLHAMNGFNHRIFRKAMLDDTGAPCLPFAEMYLRDQLPDARSLIDEMALSVSEEQVRLSDGTLCRPEPIRMTIWGDDLFMSVPFLLRMAKIAGDKKYYDDAATQVINFYKYLKDEKTGLLTHGWFASTAKPSVAFWGRANGWVVWAVSEVLLYLPSDHKDYKKIRSLFAEHLATLVNYQHESGLWHQVLDQPESWLETSCSAMYVLGIARGITNGWIDEKYRENAIRGWQGISSKIEEDGTVKGICQGTGMGFDFDFYYKRKTPDHDPRGLGAVITAGVEMAKLGQHK